MLFFKPYASRCVTLHPATGKGCRQQMSISTKEKGQGEGGRKKKKKRSYSVLYAIVSGWSYSLTEHVQADFLGFLPRLVLGDASVISFIHFLDVFYYQFWTILVQAVLITRFKDNVVTVAEGKRGEKDMSGRSHHKCLLTQLEGPTNNFFNSLTTIRLGLYFRRRAAGAQQRLGDQKKSCPVLYASENISNISTAFVCLSSPLALTPSFLRRPRTNLMMRHVLRKPLFRSWEAEVFTGG